MKIIFFITIILFSNDYIFSQNPEWLNYTTLVYVSELVNDGNNLWIGSDGGLVKLNKTTEELTFYNRANANLPDNHIRALAIDSSGYLWIGTQYSGIGKFDGRTCQVFNTTNSKLPHDQWNMEIAVDPEGNIWIGSLRYVSKFDGFDWKIYETGNPSSVYFSINDIKFDKQGPQWIGASWGLGKIENDSLFQQYDGFNKEVRAIELDTNNSVWVGTRYNGLFKYDGVNWIKYDTTNSGIPSNNIADMEFDKDGNLWIATNKGLVKFNSTNWEVFNTGNSGLLENTILSIEIDEKGIIWISFVNNCLMKFDGVNWKRYELINSILPYNAIYAIEFDNKDNVWIGTAGSKALINYDRTNWFLYDTSNSGLLNSVFALEFDNKNMSLWIGYRGKPWLGKYDGQT